MNESIWIEVKIVDYSGAYFPYSTRTYLRDKHSLARQKWTQHRCHSDTLIRVHQHSGIVRLCSCGLIPNNRIGVYITNLVGRGVLSVVYIAAVFEHVSLVIRKYRIVDGTVWYVMVFGAGLIFFIKNYKAY